MQDEIGLWIAHAILNRVQSEAYPSEPEAVVRNWDGFYGYVNATDGNMLTRMYHLAFQAVVTRTLVGYDPTDGCYFMFSSQDLIEMGKSSDTAVKGFTNGKWGLWFFREMP